MNALAMAIPYGMNNDRLSWHLWNWARWMDRGSYGLGYPGRSLCTASGHSDFDEMVNRADARCARAVDAIVEDLPQPQKLAVHHKHLSAVFRIRADLETAYELACDKISRELTKRGIV